MPASFGAPVESDNQIQINIETDDVDEAERLFNALSKGGDVKMLLQETEWAESFGMSVDKFGVQWMVMYTGMKSS